MPTKASGWTGYRPKVKSIPFIISHLDLYEKNSSKRLKVAYTKKKKEVKTKSGGTEWKLEMEALEVPDVLHAWDRVTY